MAASAGLHGSTFYFYFQHGRFSRRLSSHHGDLGQVDLHVNAQLGEGILHAIDDGDESFHTLVASHLGQILCHLLISRDTHEQTRPRINIGLSSAEGGTDKMSELAPECLAVSQYYMSHEQWTRQSKLTGQPTNLD